MEGGAVHLRKSHDDEEEAHAGQSESDKPDWYYRGLGYDEEHPRATHGPEPAVEEPNIGAGDPEDEVQDESDDEDVSEETAKPMMMRDVGQMAAQ